MFCVSSTVGENIYLQLNNNSCLTAADERWRCCYWIRQSLVRNTRWWMWTCIKFGFLRVNETRSAREISFVKRPERKSPRKPYAVFKWNLEIACRTSNGLVNELCLELSVIHCSSPKAGLGSEDLARSHSFPIKSICIYIFFPLVFYCCAIACLW